MFLNLIKLCGLKHQFDVDFDEGLRLWDFLLDCSELFTSWGPLSPCSAVTPGPYLPSQGKKVQLYLPTLLTARAGQRPGGQHLQRGQQPRKAPVGVGVTAGGDHKRGASRAAQTPAAVHPRNFRGGSAQTGGGGSRGHARGRPHAASGTTLAGSFTSGQGGGDTIARALLRDEAVGDGQALRVHAFRSIQEEGTCLQAWPLLSPVLRRVLS